jgi:hypothetical protein
LSENANASNGQEVKIRTEIKEKQKANQPGHKFNLLCDVNNTLIEVEATYSATSAVMNKI